MAEFVEIRIEETIPELEEMERLGILSEKEVKKLIQKRKDFEYRLARRSKRKADFINYINYEKKLIELIRIRRKQIGVFEKRHQIEASISRRVLKQARFLTRLWPSHLDTWALRISFSHFIGWKDEISGTYTEQVNFHGNCESVWVAWAKWEIEERRNFDKARAILLSKAPLYHPRSRLIKRELFRLELLYIEMLVNKVKHENIAGLEEVIEENRDKVLNCAVARAVYLDAVRTLPESDLYLQLYLVADKFEFAHKLREEIYRDLCDKFPDAECLWKLKAQRLVSGLGEAKSELLVASNATLNSDCSEMGGDGDDTEVSVSKPSERTKHTEKKTKGNVIRSVKKKHTQIGMKKDDNERDEKEEEEEEEEEVDKVNDVSVVGEEEEEEDEEDSVEDGDQEVEGKEKMEEGNSDAEEEAEQESEEEEEEEAEQESDEEEAEEEEESEEEEEEVEENNYVKETKLKMEGEEDETEEKEEERRGEEDKEEVMEQDNDVDDEENMEEEEGEEEEEGGDESSEEDRHENKASVSRSKEDRNSGEGNSAIRGHWDAQTKGAAEEVNATSVLATSSPKLDPKGKLELFISIFDKAMEVVGAKFVNTYIDELLPLLHLCWGLPDMTALIHKRLLKLFEQHAALLTPVHFYIWYQVMCQQPDHEQQQAQAVLEQGVRQHPAASHLQLQLARCIIKEAETDAQIMKEFKRIGSSMKGECGLTAWKEFVKHLCKDNNRAKLFQAAVDHEDQTVARGMRVLYLQDVGLQEGIKGARKLYQKLKWRPPFCGRLQAQMVELELAQTTVSAEPVREVFNISIQQQGNTNPGLWLAYVQFEKKYGDPLKAGGLLTRAEKELEAQQARVLRELNLTVQELLKKGSSPTEGEHSNRVFVEKGEEEESEYEEDGEPRPALVSLFEEEITLSYTASNARTLFFSAIYSMEKNTKKGNKAAPGDSGREWEKVLELLLGHKITLSIQEVKMEAAATEKDDKSNEKLVKPRFKDTYQPTDQLDPGEGKSSRRVNEDDVNKILASSEVLKPDFLQKTSLTPYFVSKKKAKEIRKKEKLKTKGPGWFNMKAPELTEEAKRDLEVLQMRSVLDPKRHYKNDMKVLPKYFQLAEVVDSPIDFYSSRVPKKSRKRTMVEEVMHDEEALRYQKKKYTEIIAARQKKQFKHPNVLRKKKTKKLSSKK